MTQLLPSVPSTEITVEHVRELALFTALSLPKEREAAVAVILNAWVPDANALSKKMSAAVYQTLVPATVFAHPGTVDGEA